MSGKARRALRARAHALRPVVLVGAAGATPAVLAETDRALEAHELIKVRIAPGDRAERAAVAVRLAALAGAELVQTIGRVAVLYRERRAEDAAPRAQRTAGARSH